MRLNTLLNLHSDEDVEYMEQEIYIQYNGKKCYYTIERDEEGNVIDITGYNQVIKQIDSQGNVSIANMDYLIMDEILNQAINYDFDELQYLIYEMYVNDEKEFTCKLIHPDYIEEDVTFKVCLLDCIVTII